MADHIILVENPTDWKAHFPNLPVVAAKDYLAKPEYSSSRAQPAGAEPVPQLPLPEPRLLLLAAGRGAPPPGDSRRAHHQRPQPQVHLQPGHRGPGRAGAAGAGQTPARLHRDAFELDIYFGHCADKELQELARQLFERSAGRCCGWSSSSQGKWRIAPSRRCICIRCPPSRRSCSWRADDLPQPALAPAPGARNYRYDLAILHNPKEDLPPSNPKALQQFIKAGREGGVKVELIEKKDYGRLAEYDALFIRETTGIDHYTYRFAKKAESEGMVVIDDPDSILKCTNKVYLDELLRTPPHPHPEDGDRAPRQSGAGGQRDSPIPSC